MAIGDVLVKNASKIHPVTVAAGRIFFSLPVLWAIALSKGIPAIDWRIVYVFIFSPPIEVVALVLYMRALQISPMYRTLPFLAFTPLFLILTSWIMVGEKVTLWGSLGIVCVVMGTYGLYVKPGHYVFEPVKAVISDKGSLFMLAVALLYSITANFGKMGVLYSSPSFFGAVYFTVLAIILIIWSMLVDNGTRIFTKEIMLIGITQGIMITFHMVALEIAPVSYMISVKRSSMLFGILFGAVFFGEKKLLQHSIAAMVILAGIGLISILG